jgi:pimeloyl-ACP methyl ester carboxylesterase
MKEGLVRPIARVVVIPNATPFVHLDRPERGSQLFLNEIVSFIHGK